MIRTDILKAVTRAVFTLVLAAAVLLCGVPAAPAGASGCLSTIQITAAYPDSQIASAAFQLNSDATAIAGSPGYVRLTRNAAGLWGTAFRKSKINMPANFAFNTYFTYRIVQGNRADGFVFVLQPSTNTAGGAGGDLGTTGIYPMFGVEFDTFRNNFDPANYGDLNNNHLAIIHGISPVGIQNANHLLAGQGTQATIALGTFDLAATNLWRHVWIEYNGTNVSVRIGTSNNRSAATEYLNQAYNIPALFSTNDIYMGFTASTGGNREEHDIGCIYFNNSNIGGIDLSSGNCYTSGPATITLTATPSTLPGDQVSQVCALVSDELGAPMAGQTINFTTTLGTLSATSAVTSAAGLACVNLTGPGSPGSSGIHGTHAAGAYSDTTVTWTQPPIVVVTPPPAPFITHGASTTSSYSPPSQQPVNLPVMAVQSAALSSSSVAPGAPVTVTASVANTSTVNGSTQVKLYVNGQEEAVKGVAAGSGQSVPVSFTISRSEPGTYSVYVGGVSAGSFKVDQAGDANTVLYASGALLLLAIIGGLLYMTRRKQQ